MKIHRTHRNRRAAFATAAVVILLFAASALMLTTAGTFRILHRELRFLEQEQQERWRSLPPVAAASVNATNSPVSDSSAIVPPSAAGPGEP
jgi:hypothetical protein